MYYTSEYLLINCLKQSEKHLFEGTGTLHTVHCRNGMQLWDSRGSLPYLVAPDLRTTMATPTRSAAP